MFKRVVPFVIISFLLTSCADTFDSVKRGLTGQKGNNTDEFLVRKKDPLILPPEFGKLPTPGERRAAKQETSIFEETLGKVSEEDTSAAPSSIEDSILKKIKKN